jgi:hypothetical protein
VIFKRAVGEFMLLRRPCRHNPAPAENKPAPLSGAAPVCRTPPK